MEKRSTYILFGQAGQNVAQGDPSFRNRLRKAFDAIHCTKEEASLKLTSFYLNDDHNLMVDENGNIISGGEIMMSPGDLSYEHDSRTWQYVALEELSMEDAEMTLHDGVLFAQSDMDYLYEKYEDLRPEEVEE